MSTTSKSPRKVAKVAMEVGKEALPDYSNRYSPKKFTQSQLFACLVLKEFLKTDYRGIVDHLADNPTLCQDMELKRIPHWTTVQKAGKRLLRNANVQRLLSETITRARPRSRSKHRTQIAKSALDATGFETHHTSHYFVRRKASGGSSWQKTTYKRFPKLAVLCRCDNHMILAAVPGRGPKPDITHFNRALKEASDRAMLQTLYADAGYDAEWVHKTARKERGVRTVIPPKAGRPTDKPPTGHWRRVMHDRIHLTSYGQRWQDETVFSMMKRRLGSALNARSYWSQCRALMLKALVHNIMILYALMQILYKPSS